MKAYYRQTRIRQFKATVDLSVLLRRARFRAIHRIYRPGGAGFYRCRDNFRMMVMGEGCSDAGGEQRDCCTSTRTRTRTCVDGMAVIGEP